MLALVQITPLYWAGFVGFILFCLALDLGVFHRGAYQVSFKSALVWTLVWCSLAMLFAAALVPLRGKHEALDFLTGYVIEFSLSMDNVFVIALILTYFQVPEKYQHRVLFWGILGALLMRGIMIGAGTKLVNQFQWTLYIFGGFLVFTGIKMLFAGDGGIHPEKNPVLRVARKLFPVSPELDGHKLFTRINGRRALTPLMIVLLMVETSDLIFALDSIPAIFSVTTKAFIVFTSNVFAILGLRSLYFLLAGAISYFRYLKVGLSLVLVFIGVKMLIDPHTVDDRATKWFQLQIPTTISLMVVATIILCSIVLSVMVAEREKREGGKKS